MPKTWAWARRPTAVARRRVERPPANREVLGRCGLGQGRGACEQRPLDVSPSPRCSEERGWTEEALPSFPPCGGASLAPAPGVGSLSRRGRGRGRVWRRLPHTSAAARPLPARSFPFVRELTCPTIRPWGSRETRRLAKTVPGSERTHAFPSPGRTKDAPAQGAPRSSLGSAFRLSRRTPVAFPKRPRQRRGRVAWAPPRPTRTR